MSVLGAALIATASISLHKDYKDRKKSTFRKIIEKAADSVGETFDDGYEAVSREGSKVANMATSATAAVYSGAIAAAAAAGGIAGGLAVGTASAMKAGKGVATHDSMKWDDAESAIKSAKAIASGSAIGFGAGAAVGGAAGSVASGAGAAKFLGANPMLDPSNASKVGASMYGAGVGAAVGTYMAAATAVGAVKLDETIKAMEALETEAMDTMDKAVQSGYAYGNGLKKTTKDIMSNVESVSNDMLKKVGSSNKEVSNAIKDGVEKTRATTKVFSDAAKVAVTGAGAMLDEIGVENIFKEDTVADKVVDAVGGFLDTVDGFWEEVVEVAKDVVKENAEWAKENREDIADGKFPRNITKLWEGVTELAEDTMEAIGEVAYGIVDGNVRSGSLGGKAGEIWVKDHQRGGHSIAGFWRAARKKIG
jgi:hypothetical protein